MHLDTNATLTKKHTHTQVPSAGHSSAPPQSQLLSGAPLTARTAAWLPLEPNSNTSGTYSGPVRGTPLSTKVSSAPSVVAVQIKEARGRVRGLRTQLQSITVPGEQFVVNSSPLSAASSRYSTSRQPAHAAYESVINVGWQERASFWTVLTLYMCVSFMSQAPVFVFFNWLRLWSTLRCCYYQI
jgi:hypothetical protein